MVLEPDRLYANVLYPENVNQQIIALPDSLGGDKAQFLQSQQKRCLVRFRGQASLSRHNDDLEKSFEVRKQVDAMPYRSPLSLGVGNQSQTGSGCKLP
jgi:hypothetical protein